MSYKRKKYIEINTRIIQNSSELSDEIEEAINEAENIAKKPMEEEIGNIAQMVKEETEELTNYESNKTYSIEEIEPEPIIKEETPVTDEDSSLISDIDLEVEDEPEDEPEHFYQKHIKKNYKLLHPFKDSGGE